VSIFGWHSFEVVTESFGGNVRLGRLTDMPPAVAELANIKLVAAIKTMHFMFIPFKVN